MEIEAISSQLDMTVTVKKQSGCGDHRYRVLCSYQHVKQNNKATGVCERVEDATPCGGVGSLKTLP